MLFIKYLENVNNASKDSQKSSHCEWKSFDNKISKFVTCLCSLIDLGILRPVDLKQLMVFPAGPEQALTCRGVLFYFGYIVTSVPRQIAKQYGARLLSCSVTLEDINLS